MKARVLLPLLTCILVASNASAFLLFDGLGKFNDRKFAAVARFKPPLNAVAGDKQKVTGGISFKFKNVTAKSMKMPFKVNANGKRVKGDFDFKPDGTMEVVGILPIAGFEKVTFHGDYKYRTAGGGKKIAIVKFSAHTHVTSPLGGTYEVNLEGYIKRLEDGSVKSIVKMKSDPNVAVGKAGFISKKDAR